MEMILSVILIFYEILIIFMNAQHLVRDGYCYVTVFECEDPAPEEISWDYVKSNQVDS